MKLNLLILSLIGVSVSASGIRGFVPIKGSDRRLATPKSSSSSKSKSSGGGEAVVRCVGDDCDGCLPLTRKEFKALGLTNKSSTSKSSDDRRLVSTSKSTTKSTSADDAETRFIGNCEYRLVASSPKSSSKSSSKDRRRLATPKSSSSSKSKSSGGGEAVVRCVGDDCDGCLPLTRKEFKALGLTNKSSTSKSSDDRRLVSTSKSTSKSTSTDDAETRFIGNCEYRLVASSPKSSSKSSSKDGRRLATPKSSSSKSSGGGGYRVRTVGDTTVRCVNDKSRCKKCHDSSNARKARNFAFSYLSGSKSKGSSKSNRRLAHTPKSSSKSSSYDDDDFLEVRYHSNCKIDWVRSADFDSSSTSSSKSKGS